MPNAGGRLKPGMYVDVTVVLDEVEGATVVPAAALTRREDRDGVFVLDEGTKTARWHPVEPGLREGDRVQLLGPPPGARVVTLGAHLLEDGRNGALVPADDAAAAGAALRELAADPDRRSRAGAASRELVRGWGYEPSVENFVRVVLRVAGLYRQARAASASS